MVEKKQAEEGSQQEKTQEWEANRELKSALRDAVGGALVGLRKGDQREFRENWDIADELAKQMGAGQYEQKQRQKLEEKNQDLRQKLARTESEKQKLVEKNQKLRQKLAQTEKEKKGLAEKNQDLRQQLVQVRTDNQEAEKEVKKAQDKEQSWKRKSLALQNKNKDLRQKLARTDENQEEAEVVITSGSEEPLAQLQVKGALRQVQPEVTEIESKLSGLSKKVERINESESKGGPMWLTYAAVVVVVLMLLLSVFSTWDWWQVSRKSDIRKKLERENEELREEAKNLEKEVNKLTEEWWDRALDLQQKEEELERREETENESWGEEDVIPIEKRREDLLRPG